MKTYMFPGQGSQARGMGGGLFDEFKDLTAQADAVLGYSIKDLCLNDPGRELVKTQFTQPALYVVNALSYYARVRDTGVAPDFVAGHSLGEFNALLAAECFDFETGLKLVQKRGELMSRAPEGAMAAVVNATRDKIEAVLKENGFEQVDIANYNTPQQVVISGTVADIAACQKIFQFDNVMYIPLNTSGAFHSWLMASSQQEFEAFLKQHIFADPKIPVIANLTARPYPEGAVVEYLSRQIRSTVLWSDTVQYLLSLDGDMEFVEIGHGDVLRKMIPKIRQFVAKAAQQASPPAAPVAAPAPAAAPAPRANGTAAAAAAPNDRAALAAQKVAEWNTRHPVGTKAKSLVADYDDLTTRTAAVVLFGHRAAVYMEGYNGYFDLDEIAAV